MKFLSELPDVFKRMFGIFIRKRRNKGKKNKKLSIFEKFSIFGEDTIFYIGGTEALPPPLTIGEEAKFVSMLENESERDYAKL